MSKLLEYDLVLVGDASGSMSSPMPNGKTRWVHMQESMKSMARDMASLDDDGIGMVIFSGSAVTSKDGVKVEEIDQIFNDRSPRGSTPLHTALEEALKLAGKSTDKKDLIVIYTDGEPDDPKAVESVIRNAANKLNQDDELTLLFVQVGDDPAAAKYLAGLDDSLKGAKFDIVDVKTQAEADSFPTTEALLLAAIDD